MGVFRQKNAATDAHRNGDQCSDGRHHQRSNDCIGDATVFEAWWRRELRQQGQADLAPPLHEHVTQHKDQG